MNPNCPHCKSHSTAKNGFNPSGHQRYKCGKCKRRFAELIRPRGRPVTGTAKSDAERKRKSRLNQKLIEAQTMLEFKQDGFTQRTISAKEWKLTRLHTRPTDTVKINPEIGDIIAIEGIQHVLTDWIDDTMTLRTLSDEECIRP
jgi:hypothetical protein